MLFTLIGVILLLFTGNKSENMYYFYCAWIGLGTGFWAMFVTVAAEQFGTNLRSTAATTIPNIVRGAVPLMLIGFDFLKKSKKIQRNLKGYRTSVEFPYVHVEMDPYMLGVWLGDGSQRDPVITSQDAVILHYIRDFCHRNNSVLTFQSGYDYRISAISKQHENIFLSLSLHHKNRINVFNRQL